MSKKCKSAVVFVRLVPDDREALNVIAKKYETTASSVVRRAISLLIKEELAGKVAGNDRN